MAGITVLSDNKVVITWCDENSTSGDIKYTILNADGSVFLAEATANTGTYGRQTDPQIATLEGGGFVMVWTTYYGDRQGNISYRVYDADGQPVTAVRNAGAIQQGPQSDPTVTGLDGGGFVIGWTEQNPDEASVVSPSAGAVMAREFNADGTAAGKSVRISGDWGGDSAPVFASDSGKSDGFVAVWSDDAGPDQAHQGAAGLYGRDVTAGMPGSDFVSGGTLVDAGTGSANPDIVQGHGLTITVWDEQTSAANGRDIWIEVNGKEARVNTVTSGDQTNAAIAALAMGGFIVVWDSVSATSGHDIKGQLYDANGKAVGGEFLINDSASQLFSGDQTDPDVVGLSDGRFVVTWTDNSSGGGIYAATFDPRTGPVKIEATSAGEQLMGTEWNDVLGGGKGSDVLFGLTGNDVLSGSDGDDRLISDGGNDTLIGGAGNDSMDGGAGTDLVDYSDSGAGIAVTLNSSSQAGVAVGRAVEDYIRNVENVTGTAFDDRITGDSQVNVLRGGDGDDSLNGGAGKDKLYGGDGSDTFVFSAAVNAANADTLGDFNGAEDRIALKSGSFAALGSTITSSEFRLGTAAQDSSDRLIYDRATGNLYYDADANGSKAKVLVAILNDNTALDYSDFILI